MKKIFSVLFLMLCIICLVYLYKNTDILDFVKYEGITEEQKVKYEGGWYYNYLDYIQKEIYVNYAYGVENLQDTIKIKIKTVAGAEALKESTKKAIEAYKYDYPEAFYVGSQYSLATIDLGKSTLLSISPEYTETSKTEIKRKRKEMEDKISEIRGLIKTGMSDYQKELIIHDYLASNIIYPDFEDINDIPDEMHTAYNAIVKGEAVCDGISKAFSIIMNKENIETIFAIGTLDGSPHAWNIIKLDNEYYHVDTTSDKIDFEDKTINAKQVVMHAYFNITDKEVKDKHTISEEYNYPKCTGTKYNYYYMQDNIVTKSENLDYKAINILNKDSNNNILEIRILNDYDASGSLVQTLYNNNFNNYRTKKITSIGYTKVRDIYVFRKEN